MGTSEGLFSRRIARFGGQTQGIQRYACGQVDGRWPSMLRLEQLFPRALTEVLNGLLSDLILEMGVDTAEGELLI